MFSGIVNGITGIKIEETNDTVIIHGINGYDIASIATRIWKTSVLNTHMFKTLRGTKIEFYKFFAVDVLYIFSKMVEFRASNNYLPVRKIKELVDALKTQTWLKDINNEDIKGTLNFSKLSLFNFTPKDYQQRFFEYYDKTPIRYKLNGALLNAAAGSGKSFTATATMELAGMDKIIVVCPKNALERVWYNDPMKFYKNPPKIWNTAMGGTPDEDTKIYVYHYEAMGQILDHHVPLFNQFKYGLILDESHNLNDVKSQRTQNWLEICFYSKSKNIIHSSGTPFKAIGSESVPLFKAIDPMFSKVVEEKYKKIYGSSAQRGLDILQNRLGIVSFVVKKEELGLDKPIIETLGIKVPNFKRFTLDAIREDMKKYIEERLIYYKAREEEDILFYKECLEIYENAIRDDSKELKAFELYKSYIKTIQRSNDIRLLTTETTYCKKYEFYNISSKLPQEKVKEFRNVCSIVKYLALKIQGECLGNVVGKRRIEAHRAMCEHVPFAEICDSTTKKTVVFTSFVDVLEDANNACKKQGLNPILVYGKTNNNLNGMIKTFETDKRINPLIATYDSLSTAVPLIMADTMIMLNAPFRAYIQEQAISRIHRLNQDTQTRVIQCYLDTGNQSNISSRSLDIMTWSQQQVEMITGVKSPYTIEDNDGDVKVSAESLDETLTVLISKEDINLVHENVITKSRASW